MIKIVLSLLILLLLNACSLKTPQNDWQRKSTNAFKSYTKNFLSNDDVLAYNDLSRAIKHAKQSADLTQLAKIYLGECALNISAGIDDTCQKYVSISDILFDEKLDAYYAFIRLSIQKEQIKNLAPHYQSFVHSLLKKDFKQANQEILKMPKLSSSLLSASLMRDNLSNDTREELIKSASLYGYKKIILFWLAQSNSINDAKKISILK